MLNGIGREAFDAMKKLKAADPARYQPENGADYPRSAFGQALEQIAQLTKADVGLEVAFADIGGWDTHVNQGGAQGQLATRLDDFASSIAALVADLGDRMADTVVLTMSEFGRAVSENGNRGTDHGHGNAMMVDRRRRARRTVYGKWPGLAIGAPLRRARPGGHDRLPRRLRRDRRPPSRACRSASRSSRAITCKRRGSRAVRVGDVNAERRGR